MKLYHGTTPEHAEEIIENGIQPRAETGNSNWDATDMQSIPTHVYLSEPFAPYYALAASDSTEIAIVEVDMNQLRDRDLFPDEDFIEQAIRSDEIPVDNPDGLIDMSKSITERTKEVRDNITVFQPYWQASLNVLGNISHRGSIPVEAVTRASIADLPSQLSLSIDPTIEIHAVASIRSKYETFTELLVGDDVTKTEYLVAMMGIPVLNDMSPSEMLSDEDLDKMANMRNIDAEKMTAQNYVTTIT